jgi:hypothetical protein
LNDSITAKQLSLWTMAALSAPIAMYAGNATWDWVLIVGLLCALCIWFVERYGCGTYGKTMRIVQLLGLGIVAGVFAQDLTYCWETEKKMIPLTLIALALLSASGGETQAARVSCVLAWVIAAIYILVLSAGIGDLKLRWLMPEGRGNEKLAAGLLVPAVTILIPCGKRNGNMMWLWSMVPAILTSALCAGTMSASEAVKMDLPLYEYSKSLNLFGLAGRFESLVSVAMTMGLFCLLSLLFKAAGNLMKRGEALAAAVAAILVLADLSMGGIVVMAVGLWIIWPLINTLKNKSKK